MTNKQNERMKVMKQHRGTYLHDVSQEMKRVTWPSNDVVTKASILIVIIVCIATIYVGGLDVMFSKLFFMLKGFRG